MNGDDLVFNQNFDRQFMRFMVNVNADKLPLCKRYLWGCVLSHGGTMHAHKLPYEYKRRVNEHWREAEWTGDAPASLVIRNLDAEQAKLLTCVVLGDFPTRREAIAYAVANFTLPAQQLARIQRDFGN
jgi:hypothetical protein